jgi:hypothetical protein
VAELSRVAVTAAIPGLLVLNRLLPDELDWFRHYAREITPRFGAMSELLDELPTPFHEVFADSSKLAELGPEARQELKERLAQFESEHPAKLDLILSAEVPVNG